MIPFRLQTVHPGEQDKEALISYMRSKLGDIKTLGATNEESGNSNLLGYVSSYCKNV